MSSAPHRVSDDIKPEDKPWADIHPDADREEPQDLL